MKKFLVGLFMASTAFGQSITPVVAEFNKSHGRGTIMATNNALVPQVVTVRAYSFSVVKGQTVVRDLDPVVHVKLSETSAKIPPRSPHTFDYDIVCDKSPCAVVFFSTFAGQHVDAGIKLELKIPTSAYVCADRQRDCRKYVRQTVWGLPAGQ